MNNAYMQMTEMSRKINIWTDRQTDIFGKGEVFVFEDWKRYITTYEMVEGLKYLGVMIEKIQVRLMSENE